jgi:hypothetical protein
VKRIYSSDPQCLPRKRVDEISNQIIKRSKGVQDNKSLVLEAEREQHASVPSRCGTNHVEFTKVECRSRLPADDSTDITLRRPAVLSIPPKL